jgi:hypothetical protein
MMARISGTWRDQMMRVRHQIGEAAARRRTAPLASVTLWAVICGIVVISVHAATASIPERLGSYRTGIITITSFALAALYSARKRNLWPSVRWLRLATRLPRKIARALTVLDRLETWRTAHITLGVLVLLPFWFSVITVYLDTGVTHLYPAQPYGRGSLGLARTGRKDTATSRRHAALGF